MTLADDVSVPHDLLLHARLSDNELINVFPNSGRESIAGEPSGALALTEDPLPLPKLPSGSGALSLRLDINGQPLELLCASDSAGALGSSSSLPRLLTASALFPLPVNTQPPAQPLLDDCGLLAAEGLLEGQEGGGHQADGSCILAASQGGGARDDSSSPPLLPRAKAVFDSPLGKLARLPSGSAAHPSSASGSQEQAIGRQQQQHREQQLQPWDQQQQQLLPSARPLLAGPSSAALGPAVAAAGGLSGQKRARPPPGGGTAGARRGRLGGREGNAAAVAQAPAHVLAAGAAAAAPAPAPVRAQADRAPTPLDKSALTPDFLEAGGYFDMPLQKAAAELRVGVTTLKSIMRQHNIERWPFRKRNSLDRLIQRTRELFAGDPQQCSDAVAKLERERANLRGSAVGGEIPGDVKRFRQSIFKLEYKVRRLGGGEEGGPQGEALSQVCANGRKCSMRILAQEDPQQLQQEQQPPAEQPSLGPARGRAGSNGGSTVPLGIA